MVGAGPAEYQRVVGVTWRLFAAVAVVAFLLRMEIARGYLAVALPLGLALLLAILLDRRRVRSHNHRMARAEGSHVAETTDDARSDIRS